MSTPRTTPQEWDQIRKAFQTSLMIDTSLHSLAQNLEGPDWPIKGKEETPAKYIDMELEEVSDYLALKGQPPERIDQLVSILKETLAFDQPFGEMVEQVQASSEKDNTLLKNLGRMEIPESYPIDLTGLSSDTREFCRLEKLTTLGEFAIFSQSMSQNVIVGGDFRTLLNALSQSDAASLGHFVPVRPGAKGIFLPEAIAVCARAFAPSVRVALAKKAGAPLSPAQSQEALLVPEQKLAAAAAELRVKTTRLVSDLFSSQLNEMQTRLTAGTPLNRLSISLGDPLLEAIVNEQLRQLLKLSAAEAAPSGKKRGFWARLFGRG